MQVRVKDGKPVYELTKTEQRKLAEVAEILAAMALCGHPAAGELAELVKAMPAGTKEVELTKG